MKFLIYAVFGKDMVQMIWKKMSSAIFFLKSSEPFLLCVVAFWANLEVISWEVLSSSEMFVVYLKIQIVVCFKKAVCFGENLSRQLTYR